MKVNILFFGRLADITGTSSTSIENVADTNELQKELITLYPGLAQLNYLTAVEKEVIKGNKALRNDMTVALLPPFSGG